MYFSSTLTNIYIYIYIYIIYISFICVYVCMHVYSMENSIQFYSNVPDSQGERYLFSYLRYMFCWHELSMSQMKLCNEKNKSLYQVIIFMRVLKTLNRTEYLTYKSQVYFTIYEFPLLEK